MAKFYEVPIFWKDRSETNGLGVGNNAAWNCVCGQVLLGPHEGFTQLILSQTASENLESSVGRNRTLWIAWRKFKLPSSSNPPTIESFNTISARWRGLFRWFVERWRILAGHFGAVVRSNIFRAPTQCHWF